MKRCAEIVLATFLLAAPLSAQVEVAEATIAELLEVRGEATRIRPRARLPSYNFV